ncbi:MAG TPA: arabinan endo-1,5-alpha-L-arabinosidase, partial [Chitinophagaceae bacterium]|nr:arabinan endo-1,5-alpha-L-arabinosidase [Chitinophagaceae bacterium]
FVSGFIFFTSQAQQSTPDTTRRPFPPPVGTITATRQTPVHDPVMIKEKNTYYIFCTGNGISVYSSHDMKDWRKEKAVFAKTPEWVTKALPNFKGNSMWAPDISYYDGKYCLFYAVSAFGKNTSCIGLVVNKTLDSSSADYKWEDKGKIIQSIPGRDMWNAIDPNLIVDENKTPWLAFGSFWNGMKLVKLKDDLSSVAQPEQWYTIAARPRDFMLADSLAGNAAIEAPFIFKKDKYYYLFVSWDYCCRGEKSDYKVVIGRSEKVVGPYLDKNGVAMTQNGGSLIVQGDGKEWFGAGHNSAYHFDGKDYIIYHGYDAKDRGRSKLIIHELQWDPEGWPVIKE